MGDVKSILAAGLLEGKDRDTLKDELVAAGISPAKADYELKRLDKDPYAAALAKASNRLAKRDWTLSLYGRLSGDLEVPTIDKIDPATFFRDFYATNRPVKLTGLVDHWDALSKWSLDYFDERVGNAMVQLQAQRESKDDYEIDKETHLVEVPMRDVIAKVRETPESNDFYITAYNESKNRKTLGNLYEDLGPVSILREEGPRDGFFWFGPKGTLTPFHHDLTNNLLVQVMGRKKVTMVPSWEVGRMKNALHCFSDRSPADWDAEDPSLPPRLEVEIGPGEAIFLPIGWWHFVESLDVSVSMSFTNFAADNNFLEGYPADTRF